MLIEPSYSSSCSIMWVMVDFFSPIAAMLLGVVTMGPVPSLGCLCETEFSYSRVLILVVALASCTRCVDPEVVDEKNCVNF